MNKGTGGALGGTIWFMGWLFTIGFANMVWWQIILGIVVWPFFLGDAVLACSRGAARAHRRGMRRLSPARLLQRWVPVQRTGGQRRQFRLHIA